jgi:hypothetical protein
MTPTESPVNSSALSQTAHCTPALYFLFGVLAATASCVVVFWAIRGRRSAKANQYGARFLRDAGVGVFVAALLHVIKQHGTVELSAENLAEGLLHAFFVALVFELCYTPFALTKLREKLEDVYTRIADDERILFARTEPLERARNISLIGVEQLDSRQIPAPLERPAPNDQWALTISLLRLDRLQDLLFSTDYLKHFLKLHEATKKQYRVLVVNNKPREGSETAIRSFLQMSDSLSIETYVYLKSEYYEMLGCLDKVERSAKPLARDARRIMNGQPELSLMHDDSAKNAPDQITINENYKLRFRDADGQIVEFGPAGSRQMPVNRVDCIHRILHAAIHKSSRRGLDNFSSVLGSSCGNPWAECNGSLGFLEEI